MVAAVAGIIDNHRKRLVMLCYATHHGRSIEDPHPDPNAVTNLLWICLTPSAPKYSLSPWKATNPVSGLMLGD